MILVGVKSNDLPGALTMLADYFQRQSSIWTRLKGLMFYPLIVLFAAFLLSCFLSFILSPFVWENLSSLVGGRSVPAAVNFLWISPLFLGLVVVAGLVAVVV